MRRVTVWTRRGICALIAGAVPGTLVAGRSAAHDGPHLVEVAIEAFAFVPDRIVLRAGDTLRWTNRDLAPHTATAVSGDWDTGPLEKDESAEITFDAAGKHEVFCAFHPGMTAEITVEAA